MLKQKLQSSSGCKSEVLSASLHIQILAFVGLISFAYGLCMFLFPRKRISTTPLSRFHPERFDDENQAFILKNLRIYDTLQI
eukprot:UN11648